MTIYLHHSPQWHILRAAHPGGRIVTACLLAVDYHAVHVATDKPPQGVCPACEREDRVVARLTVQELQG